MSGSVARAGGALLCVAALVLTVSGCRSATDSVAEADAVAAKARGRIRLTRAATTGLLRIPFRDAVGRTAELDLAHGPDDCAITVTLRTADGAGHPVAGTEDMVGHLLEYGTLDLYGPGQGEAVFLVTGDGGSGFSTTVLHLVNPSRREAVWLVMTQAHATTHPLTEEQWSDNAASPDMTAERAFLEALKSAYGYMDEARALRLADDPTFAPYFWWYDNDSVVDGTTVIRRLKGPPPQDATVVARLGDGQVRYTALFKGAVWGYDAKADECFVVFHPHDCYSWPTAVLKSGDWLCIATHGEGFALMNTRTWRLKRVPSDLEEIRAFEVRGSTALINGMREIELPSEPGA